MRCDEVVALGAGAVFVGIVKSSDISMAKEGGMIAILVRPVSSKVRREYLKYVVIAISISPETWASISFFDYLCGAKRVDAMHHRSAYQSHASELRRTLAACTYCLPPSNTLRYVLQVQAYGSTTSLTPKSLKQHAKTP